MVNSQPGKSRSQALEVRCQERSDHNGRFVESPKMFLTPTRGHMYSAEAFLIRLVNAPSLPHLPVKMMKHFVKIHVKMMQHFDFVAT